MMSSGGYSAIDCFHSGQSLAGDVGATIIISALEESPALFQGESSEFAYLLVLLVTAYLYVARSCTLSPIRWGLTLSCPIDVSILRGNIDPQLYQMIASFAAWESRAQHGILPKSSTSFAKTCATGTRKRQLGAAGYNRFFAHVTHTNLGC